MKTRANDNWIRCISVDLIPPSLKDNTADVDRVLKKAGNLLGAPKVTITLSLARRLPGILRECDYSLRAVCYEWDGLWHLIWIGPGQGSPPPFYCLALDLGTSTLVLRAIDLMAARVSKERSFRNPQIQIASDILARIHYSTEDGGLMRLHQMLISELNHQIGQMAKELGVERESFVALAVAGNTTMAHFFLNLDPYWICREPYIPVLNVPGLVHAHELSISINSLAPVLVFPNVGSYFGGDLVAGILSSGMTQSQELSLLVDVGTNAEVVIGNSDWLMGCAGAAGPALEGGVAAMGMMAGPGAIDKIEIDPKTLEIHYHTIQGQPPVGICGSGFIDLVAHLYLTGMIDIRGKFVPSRCGKRLVHIDQIPHLLIVGPKESGSGKPITVSQPDIDSLIRSKAAMFTILTTLIRTVGVTFQDINRFYIAGTFGSYINPRSAITIGMLPDLPLEIYHVLGNTSLEGATMALISKEARDRAYEVRGKTTYLELNVNQEFMNLFSAAKFIPHTDHSLFPSVPAPNF